LWGAPQSDESVVSELADEVRLSFHLRHQTLFATIWAMEQDNYAVLTECILLRGRRLTATLIWH
jgi:hypothetical protein